MNRKINTKLGTIIILIIAITVGVFVWKYEKNQSNIAQPQSIVKIKNSTATQAPILNQQNKNPQEISQPVMPSPKDETNKSPEQLVKDFYEWYIGNIDFRYYLVRKLHPSEDPINLSVLIQKSPFISSTYEQNMEKRRGMYDAILCTNDNEFNVVKKYSKAQINGNGAEVDILRGYTQNDNTTKIKITLKNEGRWKIDDIICNYQIK